MLRFECHSTTQLSDTFVFTRNPCAMNGVPNVCRWCPEHVGDAAFGAVLEQVCMFFSKIILPAL